MNQSILFPDIHQWNEQEQTVRFPAQQGGALIECRISRSELEKVCGLSITGAEQAVSLFQQFRFDIEELAESLIEDEDFNLSGEIEIRA